MKRLRSLVRSTQPLPPRHPTCLCQCCPTAQIAPPISSFPKRKHRRRRASPD